MIKNNFKKFLILNKYKIPDKDRKTLQIGYFSIILLIIGLILKFVFSMLYGDINGTLYGHLILIITLPAIVLFIYCSLKIKFDNPTVLLSYSLIATIFGICAYTQYL